MGCTPDVAEAMIATLKSMMPTLAEWSDQLRRRAAAGDGHSRRGWLGQGFPVTARNLPKE
jgi:hypothetical protein